MNFFFSKMKPFPQAHKPVPHPQNSISTSKTGISTWLGRKRGNVVYLWRWSFDII